jgi:ComF family protein
MIENILNIIFPKSCLNCGKQGEGYICSSCFSLAKTNLHIEETQNEIYDYFIYLDDYKKDIRTKMLALKFYNKAYIAEYFAELIIKSNKINSFLKNFDSIIPVPMFKNKKNLRGYNQTELVAKILSKKLDIPIDTNYLVKAKENKTQSLLKVHEREENVKGVFEINSKSTLNINTSIILIDDIFTTGATIRECSRILKESGIEKICILVIAKA